jgi:hypothetical protein
MAKPNYDGIQPIPPVSQIAENLWQGMRPASYIGYGLAFNTTATEPH